MADLELLRSIGTIMTFKKDEVVFREDDFGNNMYIVLKGAFGVYVNSFVDIPVLVAEISQGSFFGEMSVIDGWPRSATIIAKTDGAALAINNDNFPLLLEKSPDIADSILETLRIRAESTTEAARTGGGQVPSMPQVPKVSGVKNKMDLMVALAQHIRHVNGLLYEPPPSSEGKIKLLPADYILFDMEDKNNNDFMLQERKVTCPYCFKRFDAYIPAVSKLAVLRTEIDGRIIYKDFNILLYTNIVCPNCNYADSYREFCKYRPVPERPVHNGNQFKNAELFTGFADTHKHSYDEAILSYYLNIGCLERTTTDPLRFAKAWIRLYWIYSDLRADTYLKQAAEKARDAYEEYLNRHRGCMPTHDEIRINAILGELSAAMADYVKAREYFGENAYLGRNAPAEARDLVNESLRRRGELKSLTVGL